MFQEQNITPLFEIYNAVHVLEVKVLDPLLLKLYIEQANEHNNATFADPLNAGLYCYNNHFNFYLPEETVLSRAKKKTHFQLHIQLKRYIEKKDKRFHVDHVRFHINKHDFKFIHALDVKVLQTNISGLFIYYDKERNEVKLPIHHACFHYDHIVKNAPLYVKIVDSFTYEDTSDIITARYYCGHLKGVFI